MSCGKKSFDTETLAREALRKVPERPTGQIPYRVYRCPLCNKFHFSSKSPMRRKK